MTLLLYVSFYVSFLNIPSQLRGKGIQKLLDIVVDGNRCDFNHTCQSL